MPVGEVGCCVVEEEIVLVKEGGGPEKGEIGGVAGCEEVDVGGGGELG